MDRSEWLIERKKGIGASEAAAVLGISPWSSPVGVWAEKKGLAPPIEDNFRLKLGRLLEEPVAQLYAEREGVTLTGGGYDLRWHPGGLPVFATPDRHIEEFPRGLECKTVDPHMEGQWGEDGTGDIPVYYVPQLVLGMAVTGYPEWHLAALFGFGELRVYRLMRDMELEEAILSRLTEFWNRYVIGNEEPPLDGSDACASYLAMKYPANRLPLIGAGAVEEKLLVDLFAIREQVKADDAIQTEYENRLKAIIGEAEGIQGVCGRVTWKKAKDSEKIDLDAALKKLMAEMLVSFPEHANAILAAEQSAKAQSIVIKPGSRRFLPTPAR